MNITHERWSYFETKGKGRPVYKNAPINLDGHIDEQGVRVPTNTMKSDELTISLCLESKEFHSWRPLASRLFRSLMRV